MQKRNREKYDELSGGVTVVPEAPMVLVFLVSGLRGHYNLENSVQEGSETAVLVQKLTILPVTRQVNSSHVSTR